MEPQLLQSYVIPMGINVALKNPSVQTVLYHCELFGGVLVSAKSGFWTRTCHAERWPSPSSCYSKASVMAALALARRKKEKKEKQ